MKSRYRQLNGRQNPLVIVGTKSIIPYTHEALSVKKTVLTKTGCQKNTNDFADHRNNNLSSVPL